MQPGAKCGQVGGRVAGDRMGKRTRRSVPGAESFETCTVTRRPGA